MFSYLGSFQNIFICSYNEHLHLLIIASDCPSICITFVSFFEFPGENVVEEPIELEYPIKLADIEYMAEKMEYGHSFNKKKIFVMTQKSLQPSVKFKSEEKVRKVQKKSIPKVTKTCKHDLTKKHKSCEVCYECKSCKDMFLKKSKKPSSSRSNEDEADNCKTCGELKVKPVREFVDCVVE
jgi:hypothetical protein